MFDIYYVAWWKGRFGDACLRNVDGGGGVVTGGSFNRMFTIVIVHVCGHLRKYKEYKFVGSRARGEMGGGQGSRSKDGGESRKVQLCASSNSYTRR